MVHKRVAGVSKTASPEVKTVAYLFFPGPLKRRGGPFSALGTLWTLPKNICIKSVVK